jgi:hypothetical protein
VRSAVSILSSTSTIHAEITGDRASVIADSDFGDCFPPELDDSKRQWIESHQIQEESSIFAASETSGIPTLSSYENDYPSESDGEVEVDMILFFFQSGTESLDKQDYAEAEQFLKHCNYWLTLALQQSESSSSQNLPVTKLEILDSLFQVYFQQKQWQEAESVARESLALSQRNSDPSNKDQDVLSYTLRLAEVLIERQNYPETEFLARRCLRGYKKLGHSGEAGFKESLDVLIRICEDEGNLRKLESYKLYRLGFQRSQARSSRLSISKELKIRDDDPADTSTLEEPTNTPEVVGAEDNQEPKQEAESAGTEASKSHSSPAPSKTLESNLNSPSQIILRNSKEEHPAAASNSKAPLRAKPLDPPQESNPAADNHRDASATVAKLHNASPKLGEKLVSSRTGSLHPSERPTSQHPRWSSSSNTGYRSGEVPDQETSNLPQVNVEGPLASPASSEGRRQSWHPNHSQRNSNTDELIINVGNGSSPQENAPPIKSQNNVPDAESDSPPKNPPISRAINIYTETNTNNQPDTTELPETSKNVTRDPTMRDPGPKVSQDVITLTRGKDGQNEAVSEETNGIKNTGDQSDENDLSPKVDQSEQDEESELDDASVLIENFSINKLRGEWWSQQPVVKFLGAPGCGKSSLLESVIC